MVTKAGFYFELEYFRSRNNAPSIIKTTGGRKGCKKGLKKIGRVVFWVEDVGEKALHPGDRGPPLQDAALQIVLFFKGSRFMKAGFQPQ